MPTSSQLKRLVCGILVLSACLVFWSGVAGRVRQVNFVSQLDVERPEPDAQSFTGYKGGTRVLVVPIHRSKSMDWIVRTQKRISGATNALALLTPGMSHEAPRGLCLDCMESGLRPSPAFITGSQARGWGLRSKRRRSTVMP